jgi:hypothetical protein
MVRTAAAVTTASVTEQAVPTVPRRSSRRSAIGAHTAHASPTAHTACARVRLTCESSVHMQCTLLTAGGSALRCVLQVLVRLGVVRSEQAAETAARFTARFQTTLGGSQGPSAVKSLGDHRGDLRTASALTYATPIRIAHTFAAALCRCGAPCVVIAVPSHAIQCVPSSHCQCVHSSH